MLRMKGLIYQNKNLLGEILGALGAAAVMFGILMPLAAGRIAVDTQEVLAEVEIHSERTEMVPVKETYQMMEISGSPRILEDEEVVGLDIGSDLIPLETADLVKYDLPNVFYSSMDYSSMQPYMSYKCITSKSSPAYKVCYADDAYTDENGYRRYKTNVNQFRIDGQDDYVIALGTFYKKKGTCGDRWLIVTSKGMYTAITGDEKADIHTDSHHMVHPHGNGKYSLIEFIVDSGKLESSSKKMGSVYYSDLDNIGGEILYMYHIE